MTKKEIYFEDCFGKLRKVIDEEYHMTEQDAEKLMKIIKALDLPSPAYTYTTFLHPQAKQTDTQ